MQKIIEIFGNRCILQIAIVEKLRQKQKYPKINLINIKRLFSLLEGIIELNKYYKTKIKTYYWIL